MDPKTEIKWDSTLQLSHEDFGEKLTTTYYDLVEASTNPFPSDYVLAHFAKSANFDKPYPISTAWELLTTAKNNNLAKNGYYGAAYFNRKLCQVVITHRGLSVPLSFVAHPVALFSRMSSEQVNSAVTFVHLVRLMINRHNSKEGPRFQLSITGYSLGAWLAQITTFTVKYLRKRKNNFLLDQDVSGSIHAHTVAFHSPGCRNSFEQIIQKYVPAHLHRHYINYEKLDISVYLGGENSNRVIVNQVGTVFILQHFLYTIDDYVKLFDECTHRIEEKFVLNNCVSGFKERPCGTNEFSLNVFADDELEFINSWYVLAKNCPERVPQEVRENWVPNFTIDKELGTIKADNLNRAVAFIKLLKNKDEILRQFWESA